MSLSPNLLERLLNARRFWLMKSEPGECSIDDALSAPNQTVSWFGIRNYQARNFIRDDMEVGDAVLFYHSSWRRKLLPLRIPTNCSSIPKATTSIRRAPRRIPGGSRST